MGVHVAHNIVLSPYNTGTMCTWLFKVCSSMTNCASRESLIVLWNLHKKNHVESITFSVEMFLRDK